MDHNGYGEIQKNPIGCLTDSKLKYISNIMIVKTIRKEITSSKKSRYQISKESGVSEAQLCRLMQGKTITCETADVLLRYFGYKLKKGR